MVRAQEGEQNKKPQIYFLRLFLLRPLEGREENNEALERPKFIQWMSFSERRDGVLALDKPSIFDGFSFFYKALKRLQPLTPKQACINKDFCPVKEFLIGGVYETYHFLSSFFETYSDQFLFEELLDEVDVNRAW